MRVVLCGYYGMGNGGDEALLATLLQLLPPGVEPIALSGNPAETERRYGIAAVPRKSPRALVQALRSSQALVWGGGSLMQDASSWASPLYYAGLMLLARALGLRTIAWAQGVGPLHRPLSRWLARWAIAGCEAVTVRDRPSAELLHAWGLPSPTLAPDPVWALTGEPLPELDSLPRPRVAVVLRPCAWLTEERLGTIATALRQFQAASGAYLLLVPFQPARDRPIAETLAAALPADSRQIVEVADPVRLKGLFGQVDWAIAMRLHGVIMALAEGTPCFALAYDPKVWAVMAALAVPGWDVMGGKDQAPPREAEAIAAAWLAAWQERHQSLSPAVADCAAQAKAHQKVLAGLG